MSFRKQISFGTVCLQPKWGYLPSVEDDIRGRVCRFCMHQYLKVKDGQWTSRSSYCPLDLFSGCAHCFFNRASLYNDRYLYLDSFNHPVLYCYRVLSWGCKERKLLEILVWDILQAIYSFSGMGKVWPVHRIWPIDALWRSRDIFFILYSEWLVNGSSCCLLIFYIVTVSKYCYMCI